MSPPSNQSSRRGFLGAAAGFALGSLAGCLAEPQTESIGESPSDTPGSESDPTHTPSSTDSPNAAGGVWSQFGAGPPNSGSATAVSGPGQRDPERVWRYDAETPTMNTSPVVGDEAVYAPGSGDPGLIHAIDIQSGEQRWQFEPAGYASSAPAFVDGTLYIGTWGERFYAIDAATGEEQWSRHIGHRFGSSSPAVVDGTVYVGTIGDGPLVVSGSEDEEAFEACAFLALDAETGEVQWQYREFGERENIDASPAVADGRVVFGSENAVHALDAATGDERWTRAIATHPQSSPAIVDGVVYYGAPVLDDSGPPARLWALDAATGETLWRAPIDDVSLRTSPAVADGAVYVAASSSRVCVGGGGGESECSGVTRGQLYALDAASGDRQWTAEIKTDTRSSPAVADGMVYVGCRDGLSAVTTAGQNAWRVAFESDREGGPYVKSSPAVAHGHVFIGASDGRLRAFRAGGESS